LLIDTIWVELKKNIGSVRPKRFDKKFGSMQNETFEAKQRTIFFRLGLSHEILMAFL
jgi:hypothetical protein